MEKNMELAVDSEAMPSETTNFHWAAAYEPALMHNVSPAWQ